MSFRRLDCLCSSNTKIFHISTCMLEHVDHRALQQKILVFELRLRLRSLWIELIQLVEHQLIGSILVLVNLQTLLDYYLHERYSANILRCLCRSTNTIIYHNPHNMKSSFKYYQFKERSFLLIWITIFTTYLPAKQQYKKEFGFHLLRIR